MSGLIDVCEPTFRGEAGHCRSFLEAFCSAGRGSGYRLRIWTGRGARLAEWEGAGVELRPCFIRRLRRPQAFFLYRSLLAGPGRLFVSTAGRVDFLLLALAARGSIPPRKAYLYVHWIRPAEKKLDQVRAVAARHPEIVVMGPTPSVVEVFRAAGFRDARLVPYPWAGVPRGGPDTPAAGEFRHVLFAGGARRDKGFPRVVDLVGHLSCAGTQVPFAVQASPDHYDRYDAESRAALARLSGWSHRWVRVFPETLGRDEYLDLFEGAVCLQPYDRGDFADRVSGVTLDALSQGAPAVVPGGTWMARVVERFGAGIVVDDLSPESLAAAVAAIRSDYGNYRERALTAGAALREEHDARHLFGALTA